MIRASTDAEIAAWKKQMQHHFKKKKPAHKKTAPKKKTHKKKNKLDKETATAYYGMHQLNIQYLKNLKRND